nr:hypothetical protein [Chloroflexota bacterium]
MLGRLLGLVLLGLGWVFLRRLRPRAGRSGPGGQSGSARQVLTEGKSVLADTATELKGAASEAREMVAKVVRNTRDSAADKTDRLRTAAPSPTSRGAVGIPTTEQPADDALLMQDVAPVTTAAGSDADAPKYAADAMGPDLPLVDPIPGEVVGDSQAMSTGYASDDALVTETETVPMDDDAASTLPQETPDPIGNEESSDASAPEGLLIEPEGGSVPVSDGEDATDVASGKTDDATVAGSTHEGEPDDEDNQRQGRNRRSIEGGSGERIYPADEPRGPDDTQDTADAVGKPGPVADAHREELQSVHITPETGTSTAD